MASPYRRVILKLSGEALGLDVDGACGGFNLMFAVASGLLAGGAK